MVHGNELESNLTTFRLVCLQDLRLEGSVDHAANFPAEVIGVLH